MRRPVCGSCPRVYPLLAAAAAWHHLSAEYAGVADELDTIVETVSTASWQGPTADRYLTAHPPFLAWLRQVRSAVGIRAAAQQIVGGAYDSALAVMPTIPELTADHVAHGTLVATNFFGINTIPIALNEADYARIWVQAATVMAGYHTTAGAALAASPTSGSPPPIAKSDGTTDPNDPFGLEALLSKLQRFEGASNPLELIWPGNPFTAYPPGTDLGGAFSDIWTSFTQGLFLYDPQTLAFAQNPVQWIAAFALAAVQLVTHRNFDLLQLVYNFPQLLAAAVPQPHHADASRRLARRRDLMQFDTRGPTVITGRGPRRRL
ncbi:PPE family protein [Mycolicibacter algericus]|uniref:PPE family protein n=1 Tax=Mycolicibacter algericus TaxID=1288388 RepID=UPI003C718269